MILRRLILSNSDEAEKDESQDALPAPKAKLWPRLIVDVNIKADLDNIGQNEDFGVKMEEGDDAQPIPDLRLDCNGEEEEDGYDEGLLFDEGDAEEDVGELKFEEALIEMIGDKDAEIGEDNLGGDNEDDYEETEGSNAIAIELETPASLNVGLIDNEFDNEDGFTLIKVEDTKDGVLDDHEGKEILKNGTEDGKRHQRVHYEEDSEEEDDTSRDPDYNVEEEEGFTVRRKRVRISL